MLSWPGHQVMAVGRLVQPELPGWNRRWIFAPYRRSCKGREPRFSLGGVLAITEARFQPPYSVWALIGMLEVLTVLLQCMSSPRFHGGSEGGGHLCPRTRGGQTAVCANLSHGSAPRRAVVDLGLAYRPRAGTCAPQNDEAGLLDWCVPNHNGRSVAGLGLV